MNRYRTTPGLGPSKATASTICQKCLAKGHYSYECKSSLQSRPYATRASRTQQLRNPKLKPALTETKMSEPATDATSRTQAAKDTAVGEERGRSRSPSQEHPAKRQRRSASASSTSSVSTISTSASKSDHDAVPQRPATSHVSDRLVSRSRSPRPRRLEPSASRSRSPPHFDGRRNRRSTDHQDSEDDRYKAEEAIDSKGGQRRSGRSQFQRQKTISRSPERKRNRPSDSGQSRPNRPRSLSPYSRRLALTQAMNAR